MNRILALLVGAVVLLAVLAGVVVGRRTAPDLDPHTPEAVVQEYLKAVIAGDYPVAAKLLSPASGCSAADAATTYVPGSAQIVLDHSAVNGEHAVVTVDVTEGSGDDPFGSSGYSRVEHISLQRDGGVWKITGSPWLLPSCGSAKGRP